jgi:hypothetical protein
VNAFAVVCALRAGLQLRSGALADAEADARAAIDASPHAASAPIAVAYLAEILVERDAVDEARELLAGAGFLGSLPDVFTFNMLLFARARLWLGAGDARAAREDAFELGHRMERWGVPGNPAGTPWQTVAVRTLLQLGERPAAAALAEEQLRSCEPRGPGRGRSRSPASTLSPRRSAACHRWPPPA